jgi:hypothetical protein
METLQSFIATADTTSTDIHDNIKCLSGLDLFNYELISCTKDGFVPAVLKPIENWLNRLM